MAEFSAGATPSTKSTHPTDYTNSKRNVQGFLSYYWTLLKYFGSRLWETKGAELVSATVLAFAVLLVSFLLGEKGSARAFEIALLSLAAWLAVFALGHLIRAPWLVHRNPDAASNLPWTFGVLGIAVLVLMAAGVIAIGFPIKAILEASMPFPAIKFPSADLAAKDTEISQLKAQITQSSTAYVTKTAPHSSRVGVAAQISAKLAKLIENGNSLRDEWSKHLGASADVQRPSAVAIQNWDNEVADYLKTIPRGNIYVARFHNRLATSGSYPIGINLDIAGYWDLLESDLARLNEFLTDPDLGKP